MDLVLSADLSLVEFTAKLVAEIRHIIINYEVPVVEQFD